jgi:hypothetical protein
MRERQIITTARLWAKVKGRKASGGLHTGLDGKLFTKFVLLVSESGTATAVHAIPDVTVYGKGSVPAAVDEQDTLDVKVDRTTGELEVLRYVKGTSQQLLLNLCKTLDDMDELQPGDVLPGTGRIEDIDGNVIKLSIDAKFVPVQQSLEDAMVQMNKQE